MFCAFQFQIFFPNEYISATEAEDLLQSQHRPAASAVSGLQQTRAQVHLSNDAHDRQPRGHGHAGKDEAESGPAYEDMILGGSRYLCGIPHVEPEDFSHPNGSAEESEAEQQKELARATDRGMELLREMEGKCMYYVSGWWSYSFCYQKQVKQFHALPSGSGVPSYPPMEDPTTHSFILGRFPRPDDDDDDAGEERKRKKKTTSTADVARLQTKGGSRYLVQRLEGGTQCDLTGKPRKVEVQFHCHPQSTDRIGWIKEITTCSYLMVIYTPRLCNDVAFLPPEQDEVHPIDCREVLEEDEIPEWEARRDQHLAQQLLDATEPPEFATVGDIEVGAQKLVGSEGKKIEKGRVASAGEERVEIVAKREGGEVQQLSREHLKKYDLDQEKLETLKKRLEDLAQGKDWTLEVVTANGERGLRGIVDTDEEDEEEEEYKGEPYPDAKEADSHKPAPPEEKGHAKDKDPVEEKEKTRDSPRDPPLPDSGPPQEKQPAETAETAETGSEEEFKKDQRKEVKDEL